MITISDKAFEELTAEAINTLPRHYIDNMKNVAIVIEDEPTEAQRQKLHLVNGVTLYGLYEGIPLTQRGGNYSLVLPDKITIFKNPIVQGASTMDVLRKQIKRTVWHEIAHHYGLNHDRINELERKSKN